MIQNKLIWNASTHSPDITSFWKSRIKFSNDYIEKINKLYKDDYYSEKLKNTSLNSDLSLKQPGIESYFVPENRDITYINYNQKSNWIYNFLFAIGKQAGEHFNFDIDIITDDLMFVKYPENGGHLDWHTDIGIGEVNQRKLAITVELSSKSEYEGGDFEIMHRGEIVKVPRDKGDIVALPTYVPHKITPITKGERYSLVIWVGGRQFR